MKKLFKPYLITGTVLMSLVLFLQLFSWLMRGSKAALTKVNVSYTPTSVKFEPGEDFNIGVSLQAEDQKKISAVDLLFEFDNNILYNSYQVVNQSYFNDELLAEVTTANDSKNYFHLVLVAKKPEAELSSSVVINLSLKAGDQTGQEAVFDLKSASSQIVGSTEGNYFDIHQTNGPVGIGIGTPPPTVIVTSPGGLITPSLGTDSATLSLKAKFQGITVKPADDQNTITASVKLVKSNFTAVSNEVVFTADDDAVWSNSTPITFDQTVPSGENYTVLIKGEKHLQKKICDNTPSETSPGAYHCTTGKISLNEGVNTLDFSGILLLAGDLPEQDGIVNSYDISLVRNNLGKSDNEALQLADINKDGRVNTQDYSLIIYALSMKFDEE